MYFCIRDDDTSFFTSPEELEHAYGEVTRWGAVSLAVIPFCRAGFSKGVPEKFRGRWSVHPLHENRAIVDYVRAGVSKGRFEIMLHGYHHDEPSGRGEFSRGDDLVKKVIEGRNYLQDLLGAPIRVFVAPKNTMGRDGLRAIVRAGLHFGGTVGVRAGWPLFSRATWRNWLKLRRWRKESMAGTPWILDLGDHREIPGNPVTPSAVFKSNKAAFETALTVGGTFCAATHYWELGVQSINPGDPPVGVHLRHLIDLARTDPRVVWCSVGDVVCNSALIK
jgi:Uncharacterized protein conserved in bacteria (DUF2334)